MLNFLFGTFYHLLKTVNTLAGIADTRVNRGDLKANQADLNSVSDTLRKLGAECHKIRRPFNSEVQQAG